MSKTESGQDHLEFEYRQYALKYFEIHAQQRIKAFQYFVTLSAAIVGAMGYSFDNEKTILVFFLGLIMCFISIVFWLLDVRTRNLVKRGEEALKYLDCQNNLPEVDGLPHPLSLFERDEKIRERSGILLRYLSYRRCFGISFVMFFLLGLVAVIYSISDCQL